MKSVTELDEENEVKLRGNFTLWRKLGDGAVEIKVEIITYGTGTEEQEENTEEKISAVIMEFKAPTNTKGDNKVTRKECYVVCVRTKRDKEQGHTTMEASIQVDPGSMLATKTTEKENREEEDNPFSGQDLLSGDFCHQLYEMMMKTLEHVTQKSRRTKHGRRWITQR